jgi:hypothetical protein
LAVRWPSAVSALEPVPIVVDVIPPPGVDASTALTAVVRHSSEGLIQVAPLQFRGDGRYSADEPLRLPLVPPPGTYRLIVVVESNLKTVGDRVVYFRPEEIPVHDLAAGGEGGVHAGVRLAVPLQFVESVSDGGPWAGKRVWRYPGGEIALWWAPGPTEALLFSNALAMLEATHDATEAPRVVSSAETEWHGQTAFVFQERWPGLEGGPAEALVVQGPDYWLYVLRIRPFGGTTVPPILELVRETFSFAE